MKCCLYANSCRHKEDRVILRPLTTHKLCFIYIYIYIKGGGGNIANTYVTWQIYAICNSALWVLLPNHYFPSTNTLFHRFTHIYLQILTLTCTKNYPLAGCTMNYHYKNTPQYQLCLTYLSPAILSLPAVTPLATSVISQNTFSLSWLPNPEL
jgi:hypothetical protein